VTRIRIPAWPESEPGRERARVERHVIANIDYHTPGIPPELAPMECTCGWSGTALKWDEHRAQVGQRKRWPSGSSRSVGDAA
jgi:hypothetical protein